MKEKSLYNMITSILGAIITIPLLILGIIFNHSILTIVLMSIYYPILMTYYIIKSISYGMEKTTAKEVLYRISRSVLDLATTLISVNFILLQNNPLKWIVFGIVILIFVLEAVLNSVDKAKEIKYFLSLIKATILLYTMVSLFKIGLIVILGITSVVICYMSNLLGKILQNKIVLSFELVALILFGIFLILI